MGSSPSSHVRQHAPSPTVLDIIVTWHPQDPLGEKVYKEIFTHYHSDSFSGLTGGTVEVFGFSLSSDMNNGAPPAIRTADGVIGEGKALPAHASSFTMILPVIGRNLIQASMDSTSPWQSFVSALRDARNNSPSHVRVLPVLPSTIPDHINAPIITQLLSRQGLRTGALDRIEVEDEPQSFVTQGQLTRDLGQTLIQDLLHDSESDERLQIFVSHSRADIPFKDVVGIEPTGPVARIGAIANETKLETFVDVKDLQPGQDWIKDIETNARRGALLMVRTDHYASREWTQWEVLNAKSAGMPVVCLSALSNGEQRGSFLLDHVPTVAYPNHHRSVERADGDSDESSTNEDDSTFDSLKNRMIVIALNRIVDESLKRALWRRQDIPQDVARRFDQLDTHGASGSGTDNDGFDAAPFHAPEPLMLTQFLTRHKKAFPDDNHLWIMHPDPPLLPPEHEVMAELCALSGYERQHVHLLTPRTFFAAGGSYGEGEPVLATPNLSAERSLADFMLGISMAVGEDLGAIGLHDGHLQLAVGEIAQMMLLAGGGVTYAGALGTHAPDLTGAVVDTVQRYIASLTLELHRQVGTDPNDAIPLHKGRMFRLTVPCVSVREQAMIEKLDSAADRFASTGLIEVLDSQGKVLPLTQAQPWTGSSEETATALSNIRQALPDFCQARLLIGGKIRPQSSSWKEGYRGSYPGIVEEALNTVRRQQPLFLAGGFGGATAVLAHELGIGDELPVSNEALAAVRANSEYQNAVEEIKDGYDANLTGLSRDELLHLSYTQRGSEMAGLLVRGLLRRYARNGSHDATTSGGNDNA